MAFKIKKKSLHILTSIKLLICQKKGYGLLSVIGRIEDAINGKYKPKKYGEVDWEKALLVLRIGGPKLLNMLHVLDGYPGLRSTQNKSQTSNLIANIDSSFEERLKENLKCRPDSAKGIVSLKMDEIAS